MTDSAPAPAGLEVERCQLGTLSISRIVTGLWQIADMEKGMDGGAVDMAPALASMRQYVEAGLDCFDMADHYGSAELIAGQLLADARAAAPDAGVMPTVFTKWCPKPAEMTAEAVREGVERSRARLGVESIDLLQLHWWQYEHPGYIDALRQIAQLQRDGVIKNVGLTNFDTAHLKLVISCGIDIASNQVCFSCLDMRPAAEHGMGAFCEVHGIKLLCFGVVAGGFLTDKYLGKPEPDAAAVEVMDWSRRKYLRFLDVLGAGRAPGWEVLQNILRALHVCAQKHSVSIANVAARWVLQQQGVGAVIIGARLGQSEHIADNKRTFSFTLDADDVKLVKAALATAPASIPGDCGDEYRRAPFLTASGDLTDHLSALPKVFPVVQDAATGNTRADSGSIWEPLAGFSRATRHGDTISVSGTTATHTDGSTPGGSDAGAQTTYALDKAMAAIESLGGRREDVVRSRLYVPHLKRDWEEVARAHGRALGDVRPANTLVGAQLVGDEYLVEVELEARVCSRAAAGDTGAEPEAEAS